VLKQEDIIYVSNAWPGDNKTSAHHIAEELAKNNRLLYVEASGQRAPRASARDYNKIVQKLRKAWKRPRKIAENVFLYSPLILPFHKYRIVRKINDRLLKMLMKRSSRQLSFKDPILWIVLPHYAAVIGKVKAKGIVYYCVDEYASQPNVDTEAIKEMEAIVLEHADVVFAVSEGLVENKRLKHDNVYLSTHGVDIDHFARARDGDGHLPSDIADIRRPIAGFFGLIEDWIDLDLIRYLSESLPDVSFVFVGSVVQPIGDLADRENVYFLGHKAYESLPEYLRAFDVALLPYKLNEQVINSNPKKLREYLSGGKPVVSVRVREVERYGEVVYIADGREQFRDFIVEAIDSDSPDRSARRAVSVEHESWAKKVERISDIVARHIAAAGE
jgi:glycosyltransferase involved in cell wall biosynthesis